MKKSLRTYAPADLVTILEHATNQPASLRRYTSLEGSKVSKEISAHLPNGHIVLRFRTPKQPVQVEVSPYLLDSNPHLHHVLEAWRPKYELMQEVVRQSPWNLRRYYVPAKGCQELADALMGLMAPSLTLPFERQTSNLFLKQVETALGGDLMVTHHDDWVFSPKLGPCEIIHLGPMLPSIVVTGHGMWVSSGGNNHRVCLHTWTMESFESHVAGNSPAELVTSRSNYDGRSTLKHREITPDKLDFVLRMIAKIKDELAVEVEESDFIPTPDDGVTH